MIPGTNERFVQAGSKLELMCRISKLVPPGSTPPVIRWLRNGTAVLPGGGRAESAAAAWLGLGATEPHVVVQQAKYAKVRIEVSV